MNSTKIKYENIFGLYNFVGNIFRACLDENDRAAQRVVKKYQDDGVITKDEEDWVKETLTVETKTITKPYTKIFKEGEYRIYLVEKSKLLPHFSYNFISSIHLPALFEECAFKNILVVNKDLFLMKDMYDNKQDKHDAVKFYSSLFHELICPYIEAGYYFNNYQLPDLFGLLFYYQISGFNLTEEEYKEINIEEFNHICDSNSFDINESFIEYNIESKSKSSSELFTLMKDLIRIGEIENLGIPLIPENCQYNLAKEINDRFAWMMYKSSSLANLHTRYRSFMNPIPFTPEMKGE